MVFLKGKRMRLCLPLLLLCAMLLSGCRDSPVLREILYTQPAPVIELNQASLRPQDEGEKDEQFEREEDESAETARNSEEDLGFTGDGEGTVSADTDFSPNAGEDWTADEAPDQAAQTEGDAANPSGEPETSSSDPDGGEDQGMSEPENVPDSAGTGKQLVDGAGRLVTVPEEAETVTAVGPAAQMVEMLGGEGRLAGTDKAFQSSALARAAFPSLGGVPGWWEDGSHGISDSAFSELLAAQPDVCLEISGEHTFTDAQVSQLEEQGIAYVVLPALSSPDNLKQAVSLAAEILGRNASTGEASASIAAAYTAWADGAAAEAGRKTADAGLTSLYLAGWDSAAVYQLSNTKGVIDASGSGLALAYSPAKPQLVSAYMNAANVVNESTRIRSTHRDAAYVYAAPMFHQFEPVVSGSRAAFYSGAGEYGSAYDLFVARMISDTVYYQLGGSQFPAVIAADQATKQSLESSWFWQYHPTDENGYITLAGESFYCGVVGEYDIYVNPQGMCSWAEGSVESPLEAYWVASRFSGAYSMDEVQEKTRDFYRQFFGLELSAEQLAHIFDG